MMKSLDTLENIMHKYYVTNEIADNDELREVLSKEITQEIFEDSLKEAEEKKDADVIENVLYTGFLLKMFSVNQSVILRELIKAKWHTRHEDIALIFQQDINDPDCVDDVVKAMNLKLDYWYDEGDAFIRKCSYVLGTLRTDYAIEKLRELSTSKNEIIKKYCLHQLEKLGLNNQEA